MRLPLLPSVVALSVLAAAPLSAQPPLPSRGFDPAPAVAATPPPAVVEWWRDGGPRLRPTDSRTTALLRSGAVRSATLRALIETIESGNVIVYVGFDPKLADGLAGSVRFAGGAGSYRYLRVGISHRLTGDAMVVALAHELQHVLEVIEHPEVEDEAALAALYRRIGHATSRGIVSGWDTLAAQRTGNDVRRELTLDTASLARSSHR